MRFNILILTILSAVLINSITARKHSYSQRSHIDREIEKKIYDLFSGILQIRMILK